MRARVGLVVIAVALLLAGCSGSILMRHPDGREADCGGWAYLDPSVSVRIPDRERHCITDYQQQGYVRVPR
jgi:hypothetical protein